MYGSKVVRDMLYAVHGRTVIPCFTATRREFTERKLARQPNNEDLRPAQVYVVQLGPLGKKLPQA